MPGAEGSTLKGADAVLVGLGLTVTTAGPVLNSVGAWKLICVGLTYNSGTCVDPIVTVTPPRVVGSGSVVAVAVVVARLLPKIVCSALGAAPPRKLAAFTMALMTGCPGVTDVFCRLNTAVPEKPAAVAVTWYEPAKLLAVAVTD